ncbi:MAG: ferredoxin [Modestobacter sp.]|jgi:ferredoxin|nr:ferredoxin [Modestobacter sp.]HEV7728202.1 ferredoxin [Modestobacter sp.]
MSERLRVDPIACSGHGVCAELLPERIALDEWGYPLLAAGDLPAELHRDARRAVAACPARALRLAPAPAGPVLRGLQPVPRRHTGNTQDRRGQSIP